MNNIGNFTTEELEKMFTEGVGSLKAEPVKQDEPKDMFREDVRHIRYEAEEEMKTHVELKHEDMEKNSHIAYIPDLYPDEPEIFPGGPKVGEVEAWKKLYNGHDVFITEIGSDNPKIFIYRTLNRFEYKQLVSMADTDPLQREEIICQAVTLWPKGYDWKDMAKVHAGLPSTYAEIIMEKSGFTKEYAIQIL